MRHPISVSEPAPPIPVSYAGDFRPSGGDQALARDPETMAWLAKAYNETVQEKRSWSDLFHVERLGLLLTHAGVDLDAAQKADADAAMDVPTHLAEMSTCMADLAGASFLKAAPGAVCEAIRRRHAAARIRGR